MIYLLAILRMLADLLTGGDPTLPANLPQLAPVARFLASIYDLLLTLQGK